MKKTLLSRLQVFTSKLTFITIMLTTGVASAVYFPGETLNPTCLPNDPGCKVDIARVGNSNPYRYFDLNNSNSIGVQAPVNVPNDILLILPPTAGGSGQFLTTDGNGILTWGTGSGVLPAQTGHAGKYLQTDGTNSQWVPTTMSPYYDGASVQFFNIGNINYTGFSAPAGLLADTTYILPVDYPDSNKILQSDNSGNLSWVDNGSGGSSGVFIGKTPISHNANFSSGGKLGYLAANDICHQAFANSHICNQSEMIYSMSQLNISAIADWTDAAWIATGGAKYSPTVVPANDCNGFTHGVPGMYLGSFWMFNQTTGGSGGLGHCGNTIPLACCL